MSNVPPPPPPPNIPPPPNTPPPPPNMPPPPNVPPPGYQPYGGPPNGPKPSNYLVWAILSTLFCCLPLGIVSIVFAAQVDSKWNAGDHAGSMDSSDKAKKFAIYGAIAGVVVGILYFGVIVVATSAR